MSTGTATAVRPGVRPAPVVWLAIAIFAAGMLIGSVTFSALRTSPPVTPSAAAPPTELTRLLGNMDAAASRGHIRLFLEYRADLAELISTTGMQGYAELRGLSSE